MMVSKNEETINDYHPAKWHSIAIIEMLMASPHCRRVHPKPEMANTRQTILSILNWYFSLHFRANQVPTLPRDRHIPVFGPHQ